ncbi:hypothetical protein [Collimonas fungivorans]|uniref:hypothetical protein n=1 Tax=Collimonas fungivorans TaxID=158899 RepID=UPI0011D1B870|nr:hypothetical protein [Collimonas fungivorans]
MNRASIFTLSALLLGGCASIDNKVDMSGITPSKTQYVVDNTKPDNYPGYMAGEGNIYSCRYGIHYQSADEYNPRKAVIFASLLQKYAPTVTSHEVTLERFDVYYNSRLKSKQRVAGILGGGLINAILLQEAADALAANKDIYTFDKILIDTDPDKNRHPKEKVVGCENEKEGEYFGSEINSGHDVIVTWLKFTIDSKPYHFRTYYQFQPENKESIAGGIKEAIQMSLEGIAPKLQGL